APTRTRVSRYVSRRFGRSCSFAPAQARENGESERPRILVDDPHETAVESGAERDADTDRHEAVARVEPYEREIHDHRHDACPTERAPRYRDDEEVAPGDGEAQRGGDVADECCDRGADDADARNEDQVEHDVEDGTAEDDRHDSPRLAMDEQPGADHRRRPV